MLESSQIRNIDLNCLDAASTKVDKARELMLLQAAAHIKMARAQRALYQAKVVDAVDSGPRSLATHGEEGRGEEGKSEGLEYLGYLQIY